MNPDYKLHDSGAREEHSSGAVRDRRVGKGRFDLITPVALQRLAAVYEKGAVKYAARNWEKGMPLSRFLDSAKRHINEYELIALFKREGKPLEDLPPNVDPNEDHVAQAFWNLAAIMHFEVMRPDLDDLSQPADPPIILADLVPAEIDIEALAKGLAVPISPQVPCEGELQWNGGSE